MDSAKPMLNTAKYAEDAIKYKCKECGCIIREGMLFSDVLGGICCEQCYWDEYGEESINCNEKEANNVEHPKHYISHPSGIECIEITEHFDFCTGNAIKYLWRAGLKNDKMEDLKKAKWYIDRLIEKEEKNAN